MSEISYAAAPVLVRPDLPEAHTRAWRRLALPSAWWTGAERVALAAEVRRAWDCPLCRKRRAALSPYGFEGDHDYVGALPPAAVEAVHRLTTDSGRLKRAWFDELMDRGEMGDGHYVEIIEVVTVVVSVDAFCRGIGASLHPLPWPEPGEPTGYRPAALKKDIAWVPTIPNGGATGPEEGLFGPQGRTGNVIRALSLVPDAVRQLLDLSTAHYLSAAEMADPAIKKTLHRAQMELVAGRVSALRECFY